MSDSYIINTCICKSILNSFECPKYPSLGKLDRKEKQILPTRIFFDGQTTKGFEPRRTITEVKVEIDRRKGKSKKYAKIRN